MNMLLGGLSIIIQAVAGFFTMMLLVRTTMRFMRISFVSQLGQFVLATTNWAVNPLQRITPNIGRLDLSCLIPAWLIQVFLSLLPVLLSFHIPGNPGVLIAAAAILGCFGLASIAIMLLSGAVIVGAILSWIHPYAPMVVMINHLTAPFMKPFRRILPPISGVDLSPMLLLLALQLAQYFLSNLSTQIFQHLNLL